MVLSCHPSGGALPIRFTPLRTDARQGRVMASIHARGQSFCVRWRAAAGRQQCCTFRGPSMVTAAAAKQYIEAHGANVSSTQVYAAIDPTASRALARPPTMLLNEWIGQWLTL